MKSFVQRYWVTILGAIFLFGAFFTFFDMAVAKGWFPPAARVALGLVAAGTFGYIGYYLLQRGQELLSDIVSGLGAGVLFLSIGYASFSEHIMWSQNILLLSMIGCGSVLLLLGYKLQRRVMVLLSVLSGLLTPLIIQATPGQVNVLFSYVLVLNVVALFLSYSKNWSELRIISFFTTATIYITYYFHFDPESWGRPFFYSTSLFLVYMVGLFAPSKLNQNKFSGLNLYLGVLNAIHFVFWSVFIFSSFEMSYAVPCLIVAATFVGGAIYIYKSNPQESIPALVYFLMGVFSLAISGEDFSQVFSAVGLPYVVNASMWFVIAMLVFVIGRKLQYQVVKYAGIAAWVLVIAYWYSVAWEVEWLPWFGVKFIPFINSGALLWMVIAASGFYLSSVALKFDDLNEKTRSNLSIGLALIAHIVVGGLFTIQIQNVWEAYSVHLFSQGIAVSTSWFFYALGLFLWGKHQNTKLFIWFGGAVLVIASLKMWLWDLPGEATIYKVIFLAISGAVILLIGYVHRAWLDKQDPSVGELSNETLDIEQTPESKELTEKGNFIKNTSYSA